ncbi:LysM peptidoglycan-binding domain-containing protein [Nitriliruptoraceae bacterium ZYF776]|nr:LysM peptidoglycan-binding domain-containing protein [Profundirhabdus halotolerans]
MRTSTLRVLTGSALTAALVAAGATAAVAETYEVQPGDTLSGIANDLDDVEDWRQLYDANGDLLDDPDLILPGQVLATSYQEAVEAAPGAADPEPEPVDGSSAVDGGVWDRLAQCESSGDWSIDTGNGFYGGLQFTLDSWQLVGGSGYPHEASREEQIARAEDLLEIQGWGAWPACSSELGLR